MMEDLVNALDQELTLVQEIEELADLRQKYLGKDSEVERIKRGIGKQPLEQRREIGKNYQRTRSVLTDRLEQRQQELELAADNQRLLAEAVDVTLTRRRLRRGHQHLIDQTIAEVCEIFIGLGYQVADGPEAELAYYNFDALNTPREHPSRLESDTLYLDWGDPEQEVLLRTHTSPMQARFMEQHQPPVYVVVPGKVYRSDTHDATHSPVFHQVEGLAVDTSISMADLKGTLSTFARAFFGAETEVRLVPHFFPFTEPSAELLSSCFACAGEGRCSVCGGSGWIELMGCGMVDPAVLTAVGYDPEQVSGFAFGVGVERLAQVRHGLTPVRHVFENDLRVLQQFRAR